MDAHPEFPHRMGTHKPELCPDMEDAYSFGGQSFPSQELPSELIQDSASVFCLADCPGAIETVRKVSVWSQYAVPYRDADCPLRSVRRLERVIAVDREQTWIQQEKKRINESMSETIKPEVPQPRDPEKDRRVAELRAANIAVARAILEASDPQYSTDVEIANQWATATAQQLSEHLNNHKQ